MLGEGGVERVHVPRSEANRKRVEGLGLQQLQSHCRARVQRLQLHRRGGVAHFNQGLLLVGSQGSGFGCYAFPQGRRAHDQALQVDEAALVHFDAALRDPRFGILAVLRLDQRWNAVLVRRSHLENEDKWRLVEKMRWQSERGGRRRG